MTIKADQSHRRVNQVNPRERRMEIAIAGLAAFLGGYALFNRTVGDLLEYPLRFGGVIAGIVFVLSWILFASNNVESKHPPFHAARYYLAPTLIAVGVILGIAVVYYGAAALINDMLRWIQTPDTAGEKRVAVAITAVCTVGIGILLFMFRLRLRFLYGVSESVAGVAVAVQRVSSEPTTGLPTEAGFYLAVLTAGIYLVVRGLDNAHQGFRDPTDPVANWLKKFLAISDTTHGRS